MGKYRVKITATTVWTFLLEADSEADAHEKAFDMGPDDADEAVCASRDGGNSDADKSIVGWDIDAERV